jgi:hypothetical protein
MQKLDRLGWAAGIPLTSYGVRVGIRADRPEALQALAEYLPPGWKPSHSPEVERLYSVRVAGAARRPGFRQFHLAYVGSARLARTPDFEEAGRLVEADLHLYVAERARRRIFVHAGVVGWRGQAIVLPGRSFTGKTTLVSSLIRAGATYYSDEFAVLDTHGRVHPFPRPLSIREALDTPPRRCAPEELGGLAGVCPLPVGLVVVTEYLAGARWRPRSLSPGQGMLSLLANTVSARRGARAALPVLRRLVAQAAVIKGPRGNADELASRILNDPGCGRDALRGIALAGARRL